MASGTIEAAHEAAEAVCTAWRTVSTLQLSSQRPR